MERDVFEIPGRRNLRPLEALAAIVWLALAFVSAVVVWRGGPWLAGALSAAFWGGAFLWFAYAWVLASPQIRFDSVGIHERTSGHWRAIPWPLVESASLNQSALGRGYLLVVLPKSLGRAHPHERDWDPASSTHSEGFDVDGARFAEAEFRCFLGRMVGKRFQSTS
jgi:hypothetical protein